MEMDRKLGSFHEFKTFRVRFIQDKRAIRNHPELDRFRGTAVSRNRIHSLYMQFSSSTEKLEYIAGLRYEYAVRTVDLSFDPETHTLDLTNFFPSFNFLYAIS